MQKRPRAPVRAKYSHLPCFLGVLVSKCNKIIQSFSGCGLIGVSRSRLIFFALSTKRNEYKMKVPNLRQKSTPTKQNKMVMIYLLSSALLVDLLTNMFLGTNFD
jgi:hypothetical protein